MSITLLPHQIRAVDWLLGTGRNIFADRQGLGKTYPALASAMALPGPRMLVVPSYLQYNWWIAAHELFPNAYIVASEGSPEHRRYVMLEGGARADLLLITYEHLRMHIDDLNSYQWGITIFDEAHMLRGRESQRTMAALSLKQRFLHLITATPQMHDVGDYFPLLRMIEPKFWGSYWSFVGRYAKLSITPWGDKITGIKDPIGLQFLLEPIMLRRDFSDVGIPMPAATVQIIHVPPTEMFLQTYKQAKKDYRLEITPGSGRYRYFSNAAALAAALYKQVSELPGKIDAVWQYVYTHPDEQIVIWTWRKETAKTIRRVMYEKCRLVRPSFLVTGEVEKNARAGIVEEFKATKNGILVATIASASLGNNMQTASVCIFYEQSYLPEENQQAIGRLRRIGQTRPVRVVKIVTDKTIDANVERIQAKRLTISDEVLCSQLFNDEDED